MTSSFYSPRHGLPKPPPIVPVTDFGKDHWSLLAYVECRCVDNDGELDKRHLRCNEKGHFRLHAVNASAGLGGWQSSYGTRLKGYWTTQDGKTTTHADRQLLQHCDWACLADLEAAGYIEVLSAPNAEVALTKSGFAMAGLLRAHKAAGHHFATFDPTTA